MGKGSGLAIRHEVILKHYAHSYERASMAEFLFRSKIQIGRKVQFCLNFKKPADKKKAKSG
jgi:hypothetical protein